MLVTYQRLSSCSEYLTGYLKSIKNTQAEVKVTLSEIKKNLQGTNRGVDEAENQINDLEHKEENHIQLEQQEQTPPPPPKQG